MSWDDLDRLEEQTYQRRRLAKQTDGADARMDARRSEVDLNRHELGDFEDD